MHFKMECILLIRLQCLTLINYYIITTKELVLIKTQKLPDLEPFAIGNKVLFRTILTIIFLMHHFGFLCTNAVQKVYVFQLHSNVNEKNQMLW